MTGPMGPIDLGPRTVRQGGDLRDTIAFTLGGAPYDLTQLDDLEYHLGKTGQTSQVRKMSVAANRSFPDSDAGAGGRITFIVLQAVLDTLSVGEWSLEVKSVDGTAVVVEATGTLTIEAAKT